MYSLVVFLFWLAPLVLSQSDPDAAIRVDAGKVVHRITPHMIGLNLEDLDFQTYGGLYSQLIHGEAFQEHVDSAVLAGC
jgi:hypothetical protein